MSKKQDELLDHNYDGIQEYDNDLPRWWLWLFWFGIFFGIGYYGLYHIGDAQFTTEKIALEMAELKKQSEAMAKSEPAKEITRESLLKLVSDTEALKTGKEVYEAKCVACHLEGGQGMVGPNLTDDYWLHGGDITDIHKVLVNGVVEKGMIAWKGVISDDEIAAVAAYVWTLHGTDPPNQKAAQGELVKREDLG